MAKIAVLDIAASKTGALSILRDFYDQVKGHPDGNEWIFITGAEGILEDCPESRIRVFVRSDVKASSKARLWFDLVTGAGYIRSLGADVLFSLQNTLPRGKSAKKSVLYVHQPLGYQEIRNFSFWKKEERPLAVYQHLYSVLVNASVKKADLTIVQTKWMRDAVLRKTGADAERVVQILPEVGDISAYGKGQRFDPNFFFYPAGDILYKNHELIRKAEEILKDRGHTGFRIRLTRDEPMSREEVYRTYFESTLLFPSYIETFGLPLAEASQTGNPILVADTPFAREILEGYPNVRYFHPFRAEELARLMEEVMEGKILPAAPERESRDTEPENSYGKIMELVRHEA